MKAILLSFVLLSMSLVSTIVTAAESDGMNGMDMKQTEPQKPKTKVHKATGSVTAVDVAGGTVTIAHGPVKTLNWPAMTMAFAVKKKSMLKQIQQGSKVEFSFVQSGKNYLITKLTKK